MDDEGEMQAPSAFAFANGAALTGKDKVLAYGLVFNGSRE